MSNPATGAHVSQEAEPAEWMAAAVVPAATPSAAVASLRPVPSAPVPVAGAGASSALAQIQSRSRLLLAEAAYRLRRMGATTLAGGAAMATAATLFIASNLPQGAAVASLQGELARLPSTAGGAITVTSAGAMLDSLPPRAEAPDVVAKVYEEARAAGVELPRGQYEYVPARDGVAARYRMTFPVHATYPQIRSFLDRTLIAMPAVAVEGLRIERKSVGDGGVDAEVKLAAYVRSEP